MNYACVEEREMRECMYGPKGTHLCAWSDFEFPSSPHGGRPQREAALLAQVQAIKLAVRAGVNKEAKNNELNFPPNFERLVLGCIDADFCK